MKQRTQNKANINFINALNEDGLKISYIGGNTISSDILNDAWGRPKVIQDFSIFHSLFTYNIPKSHWLCFDNGQEVNDTIKITSENGAGSIKSGISLNDTAFLRSKRHPRYQPNRGHLFSTSCFLPNPKNNGIRQIGLKNTIAGVYFELNNGKLYAIVYNNEVEKLKEEINLNNIGLTIDDLEFGHLYDIQFQWRGVGDYFFYIDQKLVYKTNYLGNNTELTISNPAMSAGFLCKNTGDEVEIKIGCIDITTEQGKREGVVYKSALTPSEITINALNKPLIIVRNIKTFLGKPNTRDCLAFRFTGNSDQRIIYKCFITRDTTAITGGTFASIGADTVLEQNTTATSVDITKMEQLWVIRGEQNKSQTVDIPSFLVDFYFTEGDYLVFTANRENPSQSALATATIEFGEEI